MCLLVTLLFTERLFIILLLLLLLLSLLSLLERLRHHHGVSKSVHVWVQGRFRLLDWHYFRHVYFLDYLSLLLFFRVNIAHHLQISRGHSRPKGLFLRNIVLYILLNLQQFLKLIKLTRAQLGLIKAVELLQLIQQLHLIRILLTFFIFILFFRFHNFEIVFHSASGAKGSLSLALGLLARAAVGLGLDLLVLVIGLRQVFQGWLFTHVPLLYAVQSWRLFFLEFTYDCA